MKKNLRRHSLAVIFVLGLAATAGADTYTQQIQFGSGPTDFNSATGTDLQGGNGGSNFNFFDSNGGTLNSLTLSSTYTFSSSITVLSTSGNSSGTVRTESGAQFSGSGSAITAALNHAVNTNTNGVSFGNSTLAPVAYNLLGTLHAYNLSAGTSQTYSSQGSGMTRSLASTENLPQPNATSGSYAETQGGLRGLPDR